MRLALFVVCLCVVAGATLAAQARPIPPIPPTPPTPAGAFPPSYRGFSPGRPYREFAERARSLAQRDTLRCNTSRKTAQLMECGVTIRDPSDSARFYLSAYVLEGKIAMVSLTDSGGPNLVRWARGDLTKRFGPAHRRERSMMEWTSGRKVARLNWRGAGAARWISITLRDDDVMSRIASYVRRPTKRTQ